MATLEDISSSSTSNPLDESLQNGDFLNGESSPAELPVGQLTSLDVPGDNHEVQNKLYYHNNNGISSPSQHSPCPSPLPFCASCQKTEAESQSMVTKLTSKFETDITRLKREVELATKAKETIVMRYANSEMEVLKLKRDLENSDKMIKQLTRETEILNKKQKMLSTERERLSLMIDSKVHEIDGLQKDVNRLGQEISSRDFKVTWTQNKLREETEAHKSTQQKLESRIQEIEAELASLRSSQIKTGEFESIEESTVEESSSNENESEIVLLDFTPESNTENTNTTLKEFDALKQKNCSIVEENTSLCCKIKSLEQERLDAEEKIVRLQESNSEHLHQIASLHSDLAATESLKVQLEKEQDLVIELKNECQSLRQIHTELLADMAFCRAKETDLLGYTQQVTEKNVALQSEFSSVEAKSIVLEEENERLHLQIEQLEKDLRNLEKMMSQESKNYRLEKQSVESGAEKDRRQIQELQLQLDEARGEIVLLNKKLNSSVRELSKELHVARKQVKEGQSCSDALSQSSRTSSSSSLVNGDGPGSMKTKHDDSPNNEKPTINEPDCPIIPDQQLLIERIVKLQRTLAKKQDKIDFLQEHVKQLVESLQRKSKIIQTYAMSQDTDALSSNISEQNKAEVLKHGGIMASVYGSKLADDGMTLDLSLEINHKLQVVLEDTLLKNITLKDSLNTLGKEISKLSEDNKNLRKQVAHVPE